METSPILASRRGGSGSLTLPMSGSTRGGGLGLTATAPIIIGTLACSDPQSGAQQLVGSVSGTPEQAASFYETIRPHLDPAITLVPRCPDAQRDFCTRICTG